MARDDPYFGCRWMVHSALSLIAAVGDNSEHSSAVHQRRVVCRKRGRAMARVHYDTVYVVRRIYGYYTNDSVILERSDR